MTDIVFYFQVHQPFRLRRYTFFDIGTRHDYFDDAENRRIVKRVAEKCYLPMNALMLDLIERHDGAFRIAYSITGVALDQFEQWSPETLESFQKLAATGCVEFLAETSMHSLTGMTDLDVFKEQVEAHAQRIEKLFGKRPVTFRNTELVIDDRIARAAESMGFKALLGEGADHLLGWRSPHRVYAPEACDKLKLLLRSYEFSDDIAFRFSNKTWDQWPLFASTFAKWLHELPEEDVFVGLFMDYETFGEHQWKQTGIFDFMEHLPAEVLANDRFRFRTPSQVAAENEAVAKLEIPHPVSWADAERDLTAWLGNPMQRSASDALYSLAQSVRKLDPVEHAALQRDWNRLTTSDHLYYMCTKWFSDGDVHKYFSPYASPHDAFIAFMNVIDDLSRRVENASGEPLPAPHRASSTVASGAGVSAPGARAPAPAPAPSPTRKP
jgi:alpha-amylase